MSPACFEVLLFGKILRVFLTLLIVNVLILFALIVWYFNRPLPQEVKDQPLFHGVTFTREVHRQPFPLILHVVKVNLNADGIELLVTPADDRTDPYPYSARTTSAFLQEFDVQLAVNGDFFDPWRDNGFWDTYPHTGDGVNTRGLTIARGEIITEGYTPPSAYRTLYITRDNRASFERPQDSVYNAISGYIMAVENGEVVVKQGNDAYLEQRHPRTAVALDQTGETLMLFVVDGRQPNYSEGATLLELGNIILGYGGYNALVLDGGGSTTLVIEDEQGNPIQLNSSIHNRIPARERPIPNHLGIFARPL